MERDPDQLDPTPVSAEAPDATRGPGADRMPTPDEERSAEAAAEALTEEMPSVAEHYEEMTEIGANVKGEGEIPG
jgi:hypothetical protein